MKRALVRNQAVYNLFMMFEYTAWRYAHLYSDCLKLHWCCSSIAELHDTALRNTICNISNPRVKEVWVTLCNPTQKQMSQPKRYNCAFYKFHRQPFPFLNIDHLKFLLTISLFPFWLISICESPVVVLGVLK